MLLRSWWCRTFNRPKKDPLLSAYTYEELLYEFNERVARENAAKAVQEAENDKIEEEKSQKALDWAEEEELRELEELKRLQNKATKKPEPVDPLKDPANIEWMKKQMELAKEEFGEDFGEDIEEDFSNG